MTLAAFQTALADLTASPALVTAVRASAATLDAYPLTEKERARLTAIAASPGMHANCVLYRANRLAPLALNLPETCAALGEQLPALTAAYWASETRTDVHFLIEADRFARWLEGQDIPATARAALAPEAALVAGRLNASRAMAGPPSLSSRA
jgi:hypothetical protein